MKKSTGLALLVCIVLAALVWSKQGDKQERGVSRVSFTGLDLTQVNGLTVTGKHSVALKRQGGTWVVDNGRRADASSVNAALEALLKIDSTSLVTQKAERFEQLKVDSKEGAHVVVRAGDAVVADFVIGSAGAGGSNILWQDKVYSMKRVFAGTFSRPLAAWVDRRLMLTAADEITRVDVKLSGSSAYSLVPDKENSLKWSLADTSVLPEGFRFDHVAAGRVVQTLVGLRAREFVDGKSDDLQNGLGVDASRVIVHFKDTKRPVQTLVMGKKAGSNLVYGKLLPQEDTFIFSSHSSGLLTQRPDDFRDLRLVDFQVADVQTLKIRDGTMQAELKRQSNGWVVSASKPPLPLGFVLDSMAVEARLQVLTTYRAKALAVGVKPRKAKFKKARKWVSVSLQDGSVLRTEFGAEVKVNDEAMLYARGAMDDQMYYADEASLGTVLSDLTSMGKKMAPTQPNLGNLDPNSLSQLPPEIRKQILEQLQQERQKKEMLKAFEEQRTVKEPLKGQQER